MSSINAALETPRVKLGDRDRRRRPHRHADMGRVPLDSGSFGQSADEVPTLGPSGLGDGMPATGTNRSRRQSDLGLGLVGGEDRSRFEPVGTKIGWVEAWPTELEMIDDATEVDCPVVHKDAVLLLEADRFERGPGGTRHPRGDKSRKSVTPVAFRAAGWPPRRIHLRQLRALRGSSRRPSAVVGSVWNVCIAPRRWPRLSKVRARSTGQLSPTTAFQATPQTYEGG